MGINCPRIKLNWKLEGVLHWIYFYRSEKEFMKETAYSKERINIPQGLSEKTDGTKTSREIKNPLGGLYRRELRPSSRYENIMPKNSGCLVMFMPFVICLKSFSLLGVAPARGRRRWAEHAVPPENRVPKNVFGLRLAVVAELL